MSNRTGAHLGKNTDGGWTQDVGGVAASRGPVVVQFGLGLSVMTRARSQVTGTEVLGPRLGAAKG